MFSGTHLKLLYETYSGMGDIQVDGLVYFKIPKLVVKGLTFFSKMYYMAWFSDVLKSEAEAYRTAIIE